MSDPRFYLSACAVYRNEGPYLREWVAFHKLVGVERFYLYNNRSEDDGHREALAPYIEDGTVVLHEWPDCLPPRVVTGEATQTATYQHCLQNHGEDSRWIAFIDLDEFLFSPTGRALPDMLSEYERWPGVGVNWAMFGPSGHITRPEGLVTESYVRRSNRKGHNEKIKSIVDPRRVRNFCLAHFFVYHGEPHLAVDENHRPIDARPGSPLSITDEVSFEKLRVNHYTTKSEEEFRRKQLRVRVDNGLPREWTENQIRRLLTVLDEVEDRTIQMYLPALREELARVDGRAVAPA
ncbi:MAG TPA: glycosyltransferase family 92 protein [Solirubrobacterales bacterium]|nr:glycosyltransferase family 92 protein [Solirubrobacterales bacterium]